MTKRNQISKMKSPIKQYAIRDTVTGLFSSGGEKPKWGQTGKVWRSVAALKNHLILQAHRHYGSAWWPRTKPESDYWKYIPDNWEIVEVVLEPTSSGTDNARLFMQTEYEGRWDYWKSMDEFEKRYATEESRNKQFTPSHFDVEVLWASERLVKGKSDPWWDAYFKRHPERKDYDYNMKLIRFSWPNVFADWEDHWRTVEPDKRPEWWRIYLGGE